MPRSTGQAAKLRYLEQFFYESSDENHGVTVREMQEYLERQGISADRRTLYTDIEDLRQVGLDIVKEKSGRQTVYKLVSRKFDMAELQLLADMVNASKFITKKKTASLIRKLGSLTSSYGSRLLRNGIMVSGKTKTSNESVFYNVDLLHRAIAGDRTVTFRYWSWDLRKRKVIKHNGKIYEVSPWLLCCDNEKYYLVGFDAEAGMIKNFRVDKMKNVGISDTPRSGGEQFKDLDGETYLMSLFGMFGGEPEPVELLCGNAMAGVLLDRFGTDIVLSTVDEEHFRTTVNVTLSGQFYGWVMSLGGEVRLTAPEKAVRELRALAEKFV